MLLDLVRQEYPNVKGMYVDTGLEYPEIKDFVNTFENIDIEYPKTYNKLTKKLERVSFLDVIKNYGFPLISKETAKNIYYGRKALERGNNEMYEYYIKGQRFNKKTGMNYTYMALPKQWMPLFLSDIPISNQCCTIMKKNPSKQYEKRTGRYPFIGEMASDSKERETNYLKSGCNAFDNDRPISKPLGFWTEQDVLAYIKLYNLPICSVYGNIVKDEKGLFKTTGVNRTGCMWCGFGAHLQDNPNKFQQMQISEPKIHEFCMCKLGYYSKEQSRFVNYEEILNYVGVETRFIDLTGEN